MAKNKQSIGGSKFKRYPLANLLFYALFCFLNLTYIVLTFIQKPEATTLAHYRLTVHHYDELILPIVIFLVIIWIAGFFGAIMVKSYANLIKGSVDGRAFNIIGSGFLVLALSSPFISDLSSLANIIGRNHPNVRPTFAIIINYISLALMGIALLLIAFGAERLSSLAGKIKPWSESLWVFSFITFSAVYGYFLIGQAPTAEAARTYFLPRWLVLISIVLPYMFFWYRGLKAAENLYQYQKKVRGQLYKNALRYLAGGITLVIVSSIVTRTLTTASVHLDRLQLTPILLIIYGLLIIMAAGYLFIAVGAKKLQQFEEV